MEDDRIALDDVAQTIAQDLYHRVDDFCVRVQSAIRTVDLEYESVGSTVEIMSCMELLTALACGIGLEVDQLLEVLRYHSIIPKDKSYRALEICNARDDSTSISTEHLVPDYKESYVNVPLRNRDIEHGRVLAHEVPWQSDIFWWRSLHDSISNAKELWDQITKTFKLYFLSPANATDKRLGFYSDDAFYVDHWTELINCRSLFSDLIFRNQPYARVLRMDKDFATIASFYPNGREGF